MNNKKEFYLNLSLIIISPIFIIAGILMIVLTDSNRLTAFGYALILLGIMVFLVWLTRIIGMHSVNKEKRQAEQKALLEKQARDKLLDAALQAFNSKTDYPETNTLRLVESGLEFFAEGKYVSKKDFKNIPGHHFAFEITSTNLKHIPSDYDDICDLEGNGIYIVVGYHDGEALEKYANDNGIILQESVENSIGRTLTIESDNGYIAYVWTVDGDEIDYGFVKILDCKNDVLTISFSLHVSSGLCDTAEGVIELKKDTGEKSKDIKSSINLIRRRPYNTIDVSADEIQSIKQANPFLPESYITFLTEVGFADLDWIDIGWNKKTPTNLNDDETQYIKDILANYSHLNPNDFYFIGIDGADSYYAFSKKDGDKKVYIFSNDAANINSYETFEDFIAEILSIK